MDPSGKSVKRLLIGSLWAIWAVLDPEPAVAATPSEDWRTPAEKSGYRTTPRYDETMAYVRRIAAAASGKVRIETFGKTGEGRDLYAVAVSGDGVFDPEALHRAGRPVVLIQNAIHAGEMDGKDASLALLRDILVTRERESLVVRAVLVVVPIYNVDGHESFGRYNRINQNGPEEMGWRTQARNLNLNRDYMKADAPETRAFLRLWNRWLPEFFVDNHVTDGADYAYDTTYAIDTGPNVFPSLARWQTEAFAPYVEAAVTRAGHPISPFIILKDDADPRKGIALYPSLPRFACGYAILQNRPCILVEMHMLKDYRTRVTGNYEILRAVLEVVNRDADRLVAAVREADAATIAQAGRPGAKVALKLWSDGTTEPFRYRTFAFTSSQSDVSGGPRIEYRREPLEITAPREKRLRVTEWVSPPAAYIVPPQWREVTDVLVAHGLRTLTTTRPWSGRVGTYRCEGARWFPRPYEGRQVLFWPGEGSPNNGEGPGKCAAVTEDLSFPAGSTVVPLDQRAAKVAIQFLEPTGPDSALAWGFFNAIFERKEYAEAYVMEKVAREMLAKDPALRKEFEEKLASDKEFAASPTARLDFFYRRSPWWDARLGLYPVGRIDSLDGLPVAGQ